MENLKKIQVLKYILNKLKDSKNPSDLQSIDHEQQLLQHQNSSLFISDQSAFTSNLRLLNPLSNEKVYGSHQNKRHLDSCGDSTAAPCYECLTTYGAKYCKYTKAFKMYKCCPQGVTEGICSSKDEEVVCSDQLDGLLQYQVCYRDSLQCGNEIVFIVNSTIETSTTEFNIQASHLQFFNKGSFCFFKLRTYEDDDQVNINVTFNKIQNSQATIIYYKNNQKQYIQEEIQMAPGENFTYTFYRGDLKDKDIYIVAKALGDAPVLAFSTVKSGIPATIRDNSIEIMENRIKLHGRMTHQNTQFQNRLGIDFEVDRQRLKHLANKTRSKFQTACLKYKNLFRN